MGCTQDSVTKHTLMYKQKKKMKISKCFKKQYWKKKGEENWSEYFCEVLSLAITSILLSLEIIPMPFFSLQSILLSGMFLEFSLNK